MKTLSCWAVLLWLGIVLENSRGDVFSSCSLIVPFSVGCLFWLRNSYAVMLAGSSLIVRWLLEPTGGPVEVFVVLLLSCWLLNSQQTVAASVSNQSSQWLKPMIATLIGVAFHTATIADPGAVMLIQGTLSRSLISLPAVGCVVLASRVADEFGLRRVHV